MKPANRRGLAARFAALAMAVLLNTCSAPPSSVPETLPSRLSNSEFWTMIDDFSEPGGYFPSDNFVSNEAGYPDVIPELQRTVKTGGVYMGVGPEQNFTYIQALQPKIAFIIDIRRQNMLEHLFYKALMETSADRAEFLSRLFACHIPFQPASSTPEALFAAVQSARPVRALFDSNVDRVLTYLESEKAFKLSGQDEAGIRRIAEAFFAAGPQLTYKFLGNDSNSRKMPTYVDLMTERDLSGTNWTFLASENQFQSLKQMQLDNRIVPLVGDFAGDKTIISVGQYVEQHGSTVRAFYTSNVEEYLFQDNSSKRFYKNVVSLPTDSTSLFIRYVVAGLEYGRHRTILFSTMDSTARGYRGGMQSYFDVVRASR